MKMSRLTRAIPEEHNRHLSVVLLSGRERRAESKRDCAPDDSRGSDESGVHRDNMHRAAFPAAIARRAAGDFGHQPVDIRAFRDCVSVGPMTPENIIVLAQDATNTHGNGFLADSEMKQADDLPRGVQS